MLIPIRFATDAQVASLKEQGFHITGKVINGIPCLVAKVA